MPLRSLLNRREPSSWTCPVCERQFVHPHQMHACGRYTVAQHLQAGAAAAVELYERFVEQVRTCGPIAIVPTRTGIGFQVRTIFASVSLHEQGLDGHLVLARRLEDAAFTRIEALAPERHGHYFRFDAGEGLHDRLTGWLREAYAVGQQRHLTGERR
jgi:hypothetical protein